MALGPAIRRLLGPRLALRAGRCYRSVFVDLRKEAIALASVLPHDAHVLDVGGGDGEPINHLLRIRPDLRITTLDPADVVGQWIESRFAAQVVRLPRTTLAAYLAGAGNVPDAVLLSDVMHHIPPASRADFLASIRTLLARSPRLLLIVKDVEPGYLRAWLSLLADRYITGDRGVSLISRDELTLLLETNLGPLRCVDTGLFDADRPNYAIAFAHNGYAA